MQIKQVAELLGVEKKDVIDEVETLRDDFTTKGHKIAKKLTVSSSLNEELVAQIMANFDIRKQKAETVKQQEDNRREREEIERRRSADEIKRKQDEEERRKKADEARKVAEVELQRRQAEIARQQAEAQARQQAEAQAAAAAAAAAPPASAPPEVQATATATPIQTPAPVPVTPVVPPPAAPVVHATPPPAPVVRTGPQIGGPRPPMHTPAGPGQPPRGPRPDARPDYQNRGPRPDARPDFQNRGPRPDARPDYQNRPPRPEGGYPPRGPNDRPRSDRPQMRTDGPRPAGRPDDRGGPRPGGPRPDGRPDYANRGARPDGRPGGPRPGGDGRGGDRRPMGSDGRGGRPGERDRDSGRPAGSDKLQDFVKKGMQSDVVDDFRRSQRRKVPPKPAGVGEPVKDWTDDKSPAKKARKEDDGRKRIRPTQIFNLDQQGERRGKPKKRQPQMPGGRPSIQDIGPPEPKVVVFRGDFTVGEFAEKSGIGINEVMGKLLLMGELLTINHLLDPDRAEEIAVEFSIEIRIEREDDEADIEEFTSYEGDEEDLVPRPPVVTVMGHVDHGKTSLLDRIRKADVASSEHGGITQHIGAYKVHTVKGDIVFLDTPGHEAFTEMRSRGADVTDLVVLVVAANDGVMPQTVEAINHAKAAGVPILVAINKIDVPGSSIERVKQELMKYELLAEEFGGDTIMVPVSAATGQNLDQLLEYIALQTEILELHANPNRPALGTVIESHMDPARGAVATVLISEGTLRIGECFVCGTEFGRVRAMNSDHGLPIKTAPPATPVEILGLKGSPAAGEPFVVVPSENEAREIAEKRKHRRRTRGAVLKEAINLENLADRMTADDKMVNLNLIIKADVQGSLEAIIGRLRKIASNKVAIKVVHSAVGAVNNSDVQLAGASSAIILGFNIGVDPAARDLAEEDQIDIRNYQVIYALVEDIEKAMMGLLKPEFVEKEEGRAKVLQIFKVSKVGTVAGCFVEQGTANINHHVRLLRSGIVIWRGKLNSLRRHKESSKEVLNGLECGIGLSGYNDVKENDIIEFYSLEEQAITLVSADAVKKPN